MSTMHTTFPHQPRRTFQHPSRLTKIRTHPSPSPIQPMDGNQNKPGKKGPRPKSYASKAGILLNIKPFYDSTYLYLLFFKPTTGSQGEHTSISFVTFFFSYERGVVLGTGYPKESFY